MIHSPPALTTFTVIELGLLLYSTFPLVCVYGLDVPMFLQINNLHTQTEICPTATSTNYSDGKTILIAAEAFPFHHPAAWYHQHFYLDKLVKQEIIHHTLLKNILSSLTLKSAQHF